MARDELTLLVTGVGGPTPRSIVRSLKNWGQHYDYRIVGVDANPRALGLYESRYVDVSYRVPFASDDAYWPAISSIVAAEGVAAAIVQPEVEVEAWAVRETIAGLPCPAVLPPLEFVRAVRDKARMAELLEGTPFVPRSLRVQRDDLDHRVLEAELGSPYWLRAVTGSSAKGALEIASQGDADAWLTINPGITEFGASTFLPGRNVGCISLFHEGECLRSAAFERVSYLMANVAPSGITGNISLGRLLAEPHFNQVGIDAINDTARKLGVLPHGILTADLREDALGTPMVTEINVRHVAPTSCLAAGGANLSEDMVLQVMGRTDEIPQGIHEFDADLIIMRDVDGEPIVMHERDLIT